jgi:hypothetical protein
LRENKRAFLEADLSVKAAAFASKGIRKRGNQGVERGRNRYKYI